MAQQTPNDQDYYGEHTVFDIEEASQDVDIDVAQNPEKPTQKKEKTWLKALRTYKADVTEALKGKKGSLVNIVLAEKKRKHEEGRGTHLPRKEIEGVMDRVEKEKNSRKEKESPKEEQSPVLQKKISQRPLFYRIFSSREVEKEEGKKDIPTQKNKQETKEVKKEKHTIQSLTKTSVSPPPQQQQSPPRSLVGVTQEQIALHSQKIPRDEMSKLSDDVPNGLFQKNLVVIVSSILLVFIGVGLSYGAYLLITNRAEEGKKPLILSRTLIVVEAQKQIPLILLSEQEIRDAITREIDTANLPLNNIEGIYFVKKLLPLKSRVETDLSRAQQGALGIREIFFIVKNNIPPNLLRAMEDQDFLFGIHSLGANRPFFVITVESFENAFAGMLKWESFMFDDLASLFSLDVSSTQFIDRLFEDVVIKNRDARILKDSEGNIVLIYSFIDKETLVIATNEETFDEVVNRLKTPKKIIR